MFFIAYGATDSEGSGPCPNCFDVIECLGGRGACRGCGRDTRCGNQAP
jgi:hypothetical protein